MYFFAKIHFQLPPIKATELTDSDTYPLSFAQQRLWLLTQFADSNIAYNIPVALNIKGTLNIGALQKAITTLIDRHSILRTVLVTSNHEPRCRLTATSTIPINIVEYAGDKKDQSQWLTQFINAEAAQAFNVMTEPLCRIKLITFSAKHHVLNLTLHHLIADGQSLVIIAQELATLYFAFNLNEPNPYHH